MQGFLDVTQTQGKSDSAPAKVFQDSIVEDYMMVRVNDEGQAAQQADLSEASPGGDAAAEGASEEKRESNSESWEQRFLVLADSPKKCIRIYKNKQDTNPVTVDLSGGGQVITESDSKFQLPNTLTIKVPTEGGSNVGYVISGGPEGKKVMANWRAKMNQMDPETIRIVHTGQSAATASLHSKKILLPTAVVVCLLP